MYSAVSSSSVSCLRRSCSASLGSPGQGGLSRHSSRASLGLLIVEACRRSAAERVSHSRRNASTSRSVDCIICLWWVCCLEAVSCFAYAVEDSAVRRSISPCAWSELLGYSGSEIRLFGGISSLSRFSASAWSKACFARTSSLWDWSKRSLTLPVAALRVWVVAPAGLASRLRASATACSALFRSRSDTSALCLVNVARSCASWPGGAAARSARCAVSRASSRLSTGSAGGGCSMVVNLCRVRLESMLAIRMRISVAERSAPARRSFACCRALSVAAVRLTMPRMRSSAPSSALWWLSRRSWRSLSRRRFASARRASPCLSWTDWSLSVTLSMSDSAAFLKSVAAARSFSAAVICDERSDASTCSAATAAAGFDSMNETSCVRAYWAASPRAAASFDTRSDASSCSLRRLLSMSAAARSWRAAGPATMTVAGCSSDNPPVPTARGVGALRGSPSVASTAASRSSASTRITPLTISGC